MHNLRVEWVDGRKGCQIKSHYLQMINVQLSSIKRTHNERKEKVSLAKGCAEQSGLALSFRFLLEKVNLEIFCLEGRKWMDGLFGWY